MSLLLKPSPEFILTLMPTPLCLHWILEENALSTNAKILRNSKKLPPVSSQMVQFIGFSWCGIKLLSSREQVLFSTINSKQFIFETNNNRYVCDWGQGCICRVSCQTTYSICGRCMIKWVTALVSNPVKMCLVFRSSIYEERSVPLRGAPIKIFLVETNSRFINQPYWLIPIQ